MSLRSAPLTLRTEHGNFILNHVAKPTCTEHHDPQNHIATHRNELFHVEHNIRQVINKRNRPHTFDTRCLDLCLLYSCFCFYRHSQYLFLFCSFRSIHLFNLFSLRLSHIDIWLQSVITLFIKSRCKFSILHLLLLHRICTLQPHSLHSDIWLRVRFTFKGTQEAAYFRDGQAAVIYWMLTL